MRFHWRSFSAPLIILFSLLISDVYGVPLSKEQLFQLATVAASQNEFERSAELFNKCLEIDPKFAPAYNGLGLLNQDPDHGDLTASVRYFRMATEISPGFFESWNNLGRAYYALSRFNRSV